MSDRTMLNFRCPSELLDAVDSLGRERYPANTKHGCDRSKTLLDIVRAGIQALTDGSVVVPVTTEVKASDNLDKRITELIDSKTAPLMAELAELRGKLTA
jgi:hypothetical protein